MTMLQDLEVPEPTQAPQVFEREISEWLTFEDTGINRADLGEPTLWRVLVLPKQPKRMSRGGIALPSQAVDAEIHLNYIGQVVAMGPLAGKSEKFQNPEWMPPRDRAEHEWRTQEREREQATMGYEMRRVPRFLWDVKVGDWVIFGRYAGQVTTFKDVRFLTVNDDDITQVIQGPEGFRVYV
jgi:co-chaperonin GroES (HSP10)